MHMYTYDEWVAHNYYLEDSSVIYPGNIRVFDCTSNPTKKYLTIRSCWRNPKFISSQPGSVLIKPKMPDIDLDIGCLYKLTGNTTSDRSRRGCIQEIKHQWGSLTSEPYIATSFLSYDYDIYTGLHKDLMSINLNHYEEFEEILVFQSIYSGAISFQEANSSLEFYFSDKHHGQSGYDNKTSDFKINTCIHSDDTLMIVGASISFDQTTDRHYVTIQSICEPVYGHVDMDNKYNWNLLWETYKTSNPRVLIDSIMHYDKSFT